MLCNCLNIFSQKSIYLPCSMLFTISYPILCCPGPHPSYSNPREVHGGGTTNGEGSQSPRMGHILCCVLSTKPWPRVPGLVASWKSHFLCHWHFFRPAQPHQTAWTALDSLSAGTHSIISLYYVLIDLYSSLTHPLVSLNQLSNSGIPPIRFMYWGCMNT